MATSIPPPYEVGEDGLPIFKFPPFPKPPPGVKIIPFKDFKPAGIQRPALGFPDEIERDGLGIPTCMLNSKVDDHEHVPGHKKKKKRNKRKGGGGGGEGWRRLPWWEEWAEEENQRRVREFDPELPARDRYSQAGADFVVGRRMNAETQSIYDHFALFTGLLGRNLQPPLSRQAKELLKIQAGAENDYESEDDLPDMSKQVKPATVQEEREDENEEEEGGQRAPKKAKLTDPSSSAPDEVDPEDMEAFHRQEEEEEDAIADRMSSFLNDPVFSMKVFLSSHFRDKGLVWSNAKLDNAPKVLDFFLKFIIRNKILSELEPKLRMALVVVDQAKIELPATATVGYAIPDGFAKACVATWGHKQGCFDPPQVDWNVDLHTLTGGRPYPPQKMKEIEQEEVIEMKTEGVTWGETAPSGWGETEGDKTSAQLDANVDTGGWGFEATDENGEPKTWDPIDLGDSGPNTWAQAQDQVERDWESSKLSLMSFFGPVPPSRSFVHQYQPVLVEDSLRSVEQIYEPGTLILDEPTWENEQLSVVVLKPWKKPDDSQLRAAEICEIPPPGDESKKKLPNEISEQDDTRKKKIRALVPPEIAKLFPKGMVLGGVFVKVVQISTDGEQQNLPPNHQPKEWWYIEKLVQTLPSYYKELNRPFIDNLVQL